MRHQLAELPGLSVGVPTFAVGSHCIAVCTEHPVVDSGCGVADIERIECAIGCDFGAIARYVGVVERRTPRVVASG